MLYLFWLAIHLLSYLTPYHALSLRRLGTQNHNLSFVFLLSFSVLLGIFDAFCLFAYTQGRYIFAYRSRRKYRRQRQMIKYGVWHVDPKEPLPTPRPLHPSASSLFTSATATAAASIRSSRLLDQQELQKTSLTENGRTQRESKVWFLSPVAIVLVLLHLAVGVYPILCALLIRGHLAKMVWENACSDYDLMAEVRIPSPVPGSDRDGWWNTTARVEFYEYGQWAYGMDLVREVGKPKGFPVDERGGKRNGDERLLIFTVRNASMPFEEGRDMDESDSITISNTSEVQFFPQLPYLPVLNTTVLREAFDPRPAGQPQTVKIPLHHVPLYGLLPPLLTNPSVARVVYLLGREYSAFSFINHTTPHTGHLPAENQGVLMTAKYGLRFKHFLNLESPERHLWRYVHKDVLHKRRDPDVCLPPNPRLTVQSRMGLQLGGSVFPPPAYTTPWVPKGLKGVVGSENCRVWRVCGLGKGKDKDNLSGDVADSEQENWREELRKTWAVAVGLLAAEVEGWSECCMRGE